MGSWLEICCPVCGHFHALKGAGRIDPDRGIDLFGRKMTSDGRSGLRVVETYEHPTDDPQLAAAWRTRVAGRVLVASAWFLRDSLVGDEEFLRLFREVKSRLNWWLDRHAVPSLGSNEVSANVAESTERVIIDE